VRILIRIRTHNTDRHDTLSLGPSHFIVVSFADQVDLVDLIMNQNPSTTSSSAHQEEVDNLSGKIFSGSMDLQPPSSTSSPSKRGKGAHTIGAYFYSILANSDPESIRIVFPDTARYIWYVYPGS
jgi:hypothetical protein